MHCRALKMEPTILDRVGWDSPVMQEEIFGPTLPVLIFYDIKELVALVNARQKPLLVDISVRYTHLKTN